MIKHLFIQYLLQGLLGNLRGKVYIFRDITNMIATSLICKRLIYNFEKKIEYAIGKAAA